MKNLKEKAKKKQACKISIVCPFFNEELIIQKATKKMLLLLTRQFGEEFELILVDDGSTDKSLELICDMLQIDKRFVRVVVLSYTQNQGRGRALKTGIDYARGEIIVTTEVDLSWGEDIVFRLFKKLNSEPGIDFVIASPHKKGGLLKNVSIKRALLTKFGNFLIRLFFDSGITMNTGMTRAYRKNVIKPLITSENGKEFHLEVLLKLLSLGLGLQKYLRQLNGKIINSIKHLKGSENPLQKFSKQL